MINVDLLREKVISAAVLGKLSADYVPNATAKDDLEKLGITIDALSSEETPCAIKPGWEWVRVSNLGADKYAFADGPFGSNLKREHYTDEKQVRIIQLSNVGELGWKDENEKYTTYEHLETIRRSEVFCGNIVIAKMMPAGRAIIVPNVSDAYVLSSDCVKFVPNSGLNTKYLCYAINSKMFRTQVLHDVHGIGRERTSLSKLKSYLLPIPPIDEQNIIVDRIDYAFDLINQIDALQQQYESDREILKGKIIDAGIRGRLTEQLPEDGNADDLYAQIQEEKAKLINEGKIKKEKPLPEIIDDDIPFPIPDSWKWVTVNSIFNVRSAMRIHMTDWENSGIPFLRGRDLVQLAKFGNAEPEVFISRNLYEELKNKSGVPQKGDILVSAVGTLGKAYIVTGMQEFYYKDAYILCFENIGKVCPEYIKFVIESSFMLDTIYRDAIGMTVAQMTISKANTLPIPLPPLEEQKRIVSIIESTLNQLAT